MRYRSRRCSSGSSSPGQQHLDAGRQSAVKHRTWVVTAAHPRRSSGRYRGPGATPTAAATSGGRERLNRVTRPGRRRTDESSSAGHPADPPDRAAARVPPRGPDPAPSTSPAGKALVVATNHGALDIGKPTGVFASELTAAYYAFVDAGMDVDVASPAGGVIPVDPLSLKPWSAPRAMIGSSPTPSSGARSRRRSRSASSTLPTTTSSIWQAAGVPRSTSGSPRCWPPRSPRPTRPTSSSVASVTDPSA